MSFAELTGLTKPAASQHLKVPRDSGLVTVRVALDAFWGDRLGRLRAAAEDDR